MQKITNQQKIDMDKVTLETLNKALGKVIRDNVAASSNEFVWFAGKPANQANEFVWIGIIENKKAKKYKYEMYWLNSVDNLEELLEDNEGFDVNIFDCESRMCLSLKQAYAEGYIQIRNALEKDYTTNILFTDLTEREDGD